MSSVLIVDDDPVIQLLLRVNFEMEGYGVATADDGEQGLQLAKSLRPSVMLLDVMMPGLDGFAVLAALRADDSTQNLPVVLLSAKATVEDRDAGLAAGATSYVTKPFDSDQLLAHVKGLIDA